MRVVDVALNGKLPCADCDAARREAMRAAERGLGTLRRTLARGPDCKGECVRVVGDRLCLAKEELARGAEFRVAIVLENVTTGSGGLGELVRGDGPVRVSLRIAAWDEAGNEIVQQRAHFTQDSNAEPGPTASISLVPAEPLYSFDRAREATPVESRGTDGMILSAVVEEVAARFAWQFSDARSEGLITIRFDDKDSRAKAGITLAEKHDWHGALAAWDPIENKGPAVLYNMAMVHGVLGDDEKSLALLEQATRAGGSPLVRRELPAARERHRYRRRGRPAACTF